MAGPPARSRCADREVDEADRAAVAADGVVQVLIAIAAPEGLATHSATLRAAELNLIAAEHRLEQCANAVVAADAQLAAAGTRESLLVVRDAHLEPAKLVEQRALLDAEIAAAGIELDQAVLARAAADEHTEQLRTASAASRGARAPGRGRTLSRLRADRDPSSRADARRPHGVTREMPPSAPALTPTTRTSE